MVCKECDDDGKYSYEVVEGWGNLPDDWELVDVVGVGVDSHDNVFVFCRGAHPVVVFDSLGEVIRAFGEGEFTRPHGFCIGPDDCLYCADDYGQVVKKYSQEGELLMTLGTPGKPVDTGFEVYGRIQWSAGPFAWPTNVAVAANGEIFVTDGYRNARVHVFSPDGSHLRSWGDPGHRPGQFWIPHGIAVDPHGTVYVADRENSRVQVFTSDGDLVSEWPGVHRPTQVHIDRHGAIFVSEFGYRAGLYPGQINPPLGPEERLPTGRVTVRGPQGDILYAWGEGPDEAAPGFFFAPHAVCTDSQGAVYVGEVVSGASQKGKLISLDCHALQKFVPVEQDQANRRRQPNG
jgi:DNA-binding beta-propeller fold protein YncE